MDWNKVILSRAQQLMRLELYSGITTALPRFQDTGKKVFLAREFRDGHKTCEQVESVWIGQLLVANVPVEEPEVARVKLIVLPAAPSHS